MGSDRLLSFSREERAVYTLISTGEGLKAKEIASTLNLSRADVNHLLFSSPLMHELCYQDSSFRWHALIRQTPVHEGLYEFSGWYGTVREFMSVGEDEWLSSLQEGCRRIGRNLNDTRGLFHSFLDCRRVMRTLFSDLSGMTDSSFLDWELVFELRINRSRMIRIYADVLVITPGRVFSLEFKMKDTVLAEEVLQAVKYAPYLEVIFGPGYDVIPALVLTAASDLFGFFPVGSTDTVLPVASGDMLFNVFNEYLSFLS